MPDANYNRDCMLNMLYSGRDAKIGADIRIWRLTMIQPDQQFARKCGKGTTDKLNSHNGRGKLCAAEKSPWLWLQSVKDVRSVRARSIRQFAYNAALQVILQIFSSSTVKLPIKQGIQSVESQ